MKKMLKVSPASFVFDYTTSKMRVGSANRIVGSKNRVVLYDECEWTSYRFFLELFRCPIGDLRIVSQNTARLPVAKALYIEARGQTSDE